MLLNWNVSREDHDLIEKIVARAFNSWNVGQSGTTRLELEMDLTACHANGCPLKLRELLAAEPYEFAHDVGGIHRHINRETGQLENCFLPRFARLEARASS